MSKRWENVRDSRSFREFYFLAVALILAFGTLQTAGTVMDTDRPVVSVVSCSMYPELDVGDILLVSGMEFEEIEEGDIIVFSTPEVEIPVVHRVVDTHDGYLETRGDNTRGQNEWERDIRPEQIHGQVLFRIPLAGNLKLLAMDITGIGESNVEGSNNPLSINNIYSCAGREL